MEDDTDNQTKEEGSEAEGTERTEESGPFVRHK